MFGSGGIMSDEKNSQSCIEMSSVPHNYLSLDTFPCGKNIHTENFVMSTVAHPSF